MYMYEHITCAVMPVLERLSSLRVETLERAEVRSTMAASPSRFPFRIRVVRVH